MSELGASAIEPLLEMHANSGPESQANIEFLLAGLRVKDPRIEKALLSLQELAEDIKEIQEASVRTNVRKKLNKRGKEMKA